MRTVARALVIASLMLIACTPSMAQDRMTHCRPLAERGRIWAECCNQFFVRNPYRGMSRQARLRVSERGVRNRLRPV